MKQFWSFQQTGQVTNLYLLNEIASEASWWVDTVTPQDFHAALNGVRGELRVWIDSPGGDAFAGAAIHDMLREYSASGRGKTVAMVTLAASAASLIAMACDEIRISIIGTIMIHEPWSMVSGRADEHRATAEVLENVRDAQIDAYVRRTHQPREKIVALMKGTDGNGTYMTAEQAIELGFADRLMHDEGDDDGKEASASNSRKKVGSMTLARVNSSIARAADDLRHAIADKIDAAQHDAGQAAITEEQRNALLRTCLNIYSMNGWEE